MMHRLLNLFRLLLIATPDALKVKEFDVGCLTGCLDLFFVNSVSAKLGVAWESLGDFGRPVIKNVPRL